MNNKIDINNVSWVASNVATPLLNIVHDLQYANNLLRSLDTFIDFFGFGQEMGFSFRDKTSKLDDIEDDINIIKEAAKANDSGYSYAYGVDMSIANIVDLCIDQPFFKCMEDTVELLSKKEISTYTVKNSNGIIVEGETWIAGQSISAPSTRSTTYKTPNKININDILSSSFSKSMRNKQYRDYIKMLYPDLSDKDIDQVQGYKIIYDTYLLLILDKANFNYMTELEEALDGLKKVGLVLAVANAVVVLSPSAAAFLGSMASGITTTSTIVNGALSIVDVYSLISGKDINGNALTDNERKSLIKSVSIDGTFFALSVYSKIQLKHTNNITIEKASGTNFDDMVNRLNAIIDVVDLEGTWNENPTDSKKDIDDIKDNHVGNNYPVIDKNGVVTNVKSIDLNAETYQNGKTLENTIKKDIDKLTNYNDLDKSSDITGKQLQIVVPITELTEAQIQAISNAKSYGEQKGIKVIIAVRR